MTAKGSYALLIYRTPDRVLTDDEERVALEAHRNLQSQLSARGELQAVARLDDDRGGKTVQRDGSAHRVTDGPYLETKEWLVGFYLLDCDDEASAVEAAKALVPAEGHAIEVRPVQWRWQS
jgi:hypothetical protein